MAKNSYIYNGSAWEPFGGSYSVLANPNPSGSVMAYAGSTAPSGWLSCDGSAVSRTTYAALFAVCNTTYGSGDGSTTFNLPNLGGRVPVGKATSGTFLTLGSTGGVESVTLTALQSGIRAHAHGASSGTESADHSHSGNTGNVSSDHSHGFSFTETTDSTGDGAARYDSSGAASQGAQNYGTGGISANHYHGFSTGGRSAAHTHAITVNDATASAATDAHTNLQPYIVLHYIIKT